MNNKEYLKKWYLLNRDRIIEKSKKWYRDNKEYKLDYLRQRRPRDNYLRSKRRKKNIEKFRDNESLWAHKNGKRLAQKRKVERLERFTENQEQTLSGIKYKKWNSGEVKYLEDNFENKTILQLAKHLDRTWAATSRKLYKLRLVKFPRRIDKLLANQNNK